MRDKVGGGRFFGAVIVALLVLMFVLSRTPSRAVTPAVSTKTPAPEAMLTPPVPAPTLEVIGRETAVKVTVDGSTFTYYGRGLQVYSNGFYMGTATLGGRWVYKSEGVTGAKWEGPYAGVYFVYSNPDFAGFAASAGSYRSEGPPTAVKQIRISDGISSRGLLTLFFLKGGKVSQERYVAEYRIGRGGVIFQTNAIEVAKPWFVGQDGLSQRGTLTAFLTSGNAEGLVAYLFEEYPSIATGK